MSEKTPSQKKAMFKHQWNTKRMWTKAEVAAIAKSVFEAEMAKLKGGNKNE